jgi:hypothetical protein
MPKRIRALGTVLLLSVIPCSAQRILYDPVRDAQAQSTVTSSNSVTSTSLFETQLRNLDQLSRQQLETILNWQEVQMRASLNSFTTWADVMRVLKRVDGELAPFLDDEEMAAKERAAEITRRSAELRQQLADLKKSMPQGSLTVEELFSRLGQADEILEFANGALGANPARLMALNELAATLEQVGKLYASVRGILAAKAAVSVPVSSLRPNPLETELQLLQVEEQHWKALGLIRARRAMEVGDIKMLLDRANTNAGRFAANEKIEDTFEGFRAARDRDRLELAIYVVHLASAVAAQQAASARLAELRNSIEVRRYSIQQSAVNAGVYEQTARAAARRLATYWNSGIRPKDLAELMLHLSTAVSLPVIAAK